MSWFTDLRDRLLCKYLGINCPPPPPPPPEQFYLVERGKTSDVLTLRTPCAVILEVENLKPTDPMVEGHILWGVKHGADWNGGNTVPPKTIYCFSAKDYKLKCDGWGEHRIDGGQWNPAVRYRVALEITKFRTTFSIFQGTTLKATTSVELPAPPIVDIWYGWPQSKRNGCEGLRIYNVKTTVDAP